MNATISPFKLTPDDMAELDRKTAAGLQPLLDALNVTMQQLVQAVNALPGEQFVTVALQTDTTLADSFPITFKHGLSTRPRGVWLANCQPKDTAHSLTTPFVAQGFSLTDGGLVSVPWVTGLLASNAYTLTFYVR